MALILQQAQHEGLTLSLSKGEARVPSLARSYGTFFEISLIERQAGTF
jgi:hypothetical protein